jgi:DNA-dependent RNA polymerase auxiliary subunit epsilon
MLLTFRKLPKITLRKTRNIYIAIIQSQPLFKLLKDTKYHLESIEL